LEAGTGMKFDIKKTINYWREGADYDLETAEALFKIKRYPYALFFGHLSLEKILKALVVKESEKHAPYTHSLPLLSSKLPFITEEIRKKLARFMEFYLESRYPEERKSFYKKCTKKFTEKSLKEIKVIFQWLKKKL